MRIALVSSIKRSADGEMLAQGQLAGRSVLSWQVKQALDAGCERIICLCHAPAPHILDEQHLVEAKGLDFHAVRAPAQIAGLVRAEDDILMQLDGLIIAQTAFEGVLGEGDAFEPAIQTLPSDHRLSIAHPEDFERIDRDRNWAGLAIVPGACVSALEDMPGDGEAMSLLLRLALQVRTPCQTLDAGLLDKAQWFLSNDAEATAKLEEEMLGSAIEPASWTGPSAFLATAIVKATATRWLGSGPEIAAVFATVLMVCGSALAGLGLAAGGIGVGALASFAALLALVSSTLRAGLSNDGNIPIALRYLGPIVLGLVALLLILAHMPSAGLAIKIIVPLIAVGLASLAGRTANNNASAFWRDTPTHLIIFAIAALFGFPSEALLLFSLGALLQLMLRTRDKSARD